MARNKTKLALRVNDDNPNHHLWNNRGVWWCHLTVHKNDATSERLRFSLKTRDLDSARVVETVFCVILLSTTRLLHKPRIEIDNLDIPASHWR